MLNVLGSKEMVLHIWIFFSTFLLLGSSQHNRWTLIFKGLYFYLYLYLHLYLMYCVSRQIWKTEQETLAEVVGCSTTDWSTNLLRSTCKKWQICGLQVSQYIKGGTKRAWQHSLLARLCSTGTTPGEGGLSSLGAESWVPEIRNVVQSELSNRHTRLIYFYRGVATREREDKETHLNVM